MVAAIPAVRQALLGLQRRFAADPAGRRRAARSSTAATSARSSARSATVKLFVTASPEARARRRLEELRERGGAAIYAHVLQDMKERDARDARVESRP